MSKYYLAIDNKKAKNNDKSDRYKIIPISEFDKTATDTIASIINFTKHYKDENALKEELLLKGLITKEDLDKHFTICYKSPKNKAGINLWKKCGKYSKDESGVLFEDEAYLFNPNDFTLELYSLGLNQGSYFDYDSCTDKEKINYQLVEMLCKEILNNKFYEYDRIDYKASDILAYLKDAKQNGFVNNYYNGYVYELIADLCYKFDKFDTKKTTPLKNKNGKVIFNERHFYELVIYYARIKKEFYTLYNQKKAEINNTAKANEEPVRVRKPYEGKQITFNDILKG